MLSYRDCLLKNLSQDNNQIDDNNSTHDIIETIDNPIVYSVVNSIIGPEVVKPTAVYPVLDNELNKIRALSSFKNNLVEHLIKYFRSHKLYNSGKLKYIRTQMYNHFPNWFFNLNNKGLIQDFIPVGSMEIQENLDYIFAENKLEKRNDFDSKLLVFNPKYIKNHLITTKIVRTEKYHFIKYHLETNNGDWKLLSITRKQFINLKNRYNGEAGLFDQYVAILLLRYKFLGGLNNHLSIPPVVYSKLKIDAELFGSPFNVSVNSYCSPFKDIEKYFGSQGPFLGIKLENKKVYAANPPYDVKIVESMAHWFEEQFERKDITDVTVYLTIPLWRKDFPGYQILRASSYFREEAELGREDYPFLHYFRGRLIPASDTFLMILSTHQQVKYGCSEVKRIWPQVKLHPISNHDNDF